MNAKCHVFNRHIIQCANYVELFLIIEILKKETLYKKKTKWSIIIVSGIHPLPSNVQQLSQIVFLYFAFLLTKLH